MSTKHEVARACRRGWRHLEGGRYDEAAREFQDALDADEQNLEALEGLGSSQWHIVEQIDKAMDDVIRPGSMPLEQLLQTGKHARPGTISIDGVKFGGAEFRRTIDLAERTGQLLQRAFDRGTTRVAVLEALARLPVVEASVQRRAVERALKISPRSAWANFLRGMEYVHRKDYAPAARHLEAAVRADPDRGEWRSELGSVYVNQERYREAIEQLQVAVRLKPSYASSWYNLGSACLRLNDRRRAMEAYRRFLEIEPYSTDAMNLRSWFPELRR